MPYGQPSSPMTDNTPRLAYFSTSMATSSPCCCPILRIFLNMYLVSLLYDYTLQELAHEDGDFGVVRFEREAPTIDEMHFGVGKVALESLRARRNE